jgi:D-alanine-D-alanine ligase
MDKKIRVGILFGGRSAEHEVSIQSAKNVFSALDKDKYEPVLIGIDRTGKWYLNDPSIFSLRAYSQELKQIGDSTKELTIDPGASDSSLVSAHSDTNNPIDVIFPVLHGTYGEDGTVQGMLKLLNIPFVGASVLGAAVGMDKDVMKKLLRAEGLPICNHLVFHDFEKSEINYEHVTSKLGEVVFVKPANLGSSVGVSKAKTREGFEQAVTEAFQFDRKILVEEAIQCEEVECSVLGNDEPIASKVGRIIPNHEFYSYEAKYLDENGAILEIPAKISDEMVKEVQDLAVKAFKALYCEGMARADFFLEKETNKLFVNEINTIPGFTKISMYPKLWEASGMSYTELVNRLIELALERFHKEQKLKTVR